MAKAEKIYINGINAVTGDYFTKPMTVKQVVRQALRERDRRIPVFLRAVWGAEHLGPEPDWSNPAEAGWGVVFHQDEDERVKQALQPLIAHRMTQIEPMRLKVLEYRSGWVSSQGKTAVSEDYPLGLKDANRKGLYKQLSWAANEMTRGYTLWENSAVAVWTLSDGTVMRADATINGATAGIQYLMSLLLDKADWKTAVSPAGFYAVYERLFGFPFAFSIEPLVPENITQPELMLPFAAGDTWYFTGGPHVGWGTGSAYAGIDFAPPGEEFGCYESKTPVVAAADGMVVRSGNGVVVQDLDGDGREQTGWSLLYLHIASEGRAAAGTYLRQGDLIGYPSCEGGFSTGTHLHLARRYNGVWISADGEVPFVLSGWTSESAGIEYDGYLVKNGQTVEAFNGRADFNAIGR